MTIGGNITSVNVDVLAYGLQYLVLGDRYSAKASCRKLNIAFFEIPDHQQTKLLLDMFDHIILNGVQINVKYMEELRCIYDRIKLSELFMLEFPELIIRCQSIKDSWTRSQALLAIQSMIQWDVATTNRRILMKAGPQVSMHQHYTDLLIISNKLLPVDQLAHAVSDKFDMEILKFLYQYLYQKFVKSGYFPTFPSIRNGTSSVQMNHLLRFMNNYGFIMVHESWLSTNWSSNNSVRYIYNMRQCSSFFDQNPMELGRFQASYLYKLINENSVDIRQLLQDLERLGSPGLVEFFIEAAINSYRWGLTVDDAEGRRMMQVFHENDLMLSIEGSLAKNANASAKRTADQYHLPMACFWVALILFLRVYFWIHPLSTLITSRRFS